MPNLRRLLASEGAMPPRPLVVHPCTRPPQLTALLLTLAAMVLLPSALVVTAQSSGGEATYVGVIMTPNIFSSLDAFMLEPVQLLGLSQSMSKMGQLQSTEDYRILLYTQVLALPLNSSIAMIYVGLADGRFLGYLGRYSYVYRPSGHALAPASNWSPFSLPTVSQTCIPEPAPSLQRCGEQVTHATENIRTFHSTSETQLGTPGALVGWDTYNNSCRDWYTSAAQHTQGEGWIGWSSVYTFAGGEVGLTARGTIAAGGDVVAVLAVDYQLLGISALLRQATDGAQGIFAYIVEPNGDVAGKLIGVAPHENLVTVGSASHRVDATDSNHPFVAASAGLLAPQQWVPQFIRGNISAGSGNGLEITFEAVATRFGSLGMQWVVSGHSVSL